MCKLKRSVILEIPFLLLDTHLNFALSETVEREPLLVHVLKQIEYWSWCKWALVQIFLQLSQSVEHESLNLRVVGSSSTLGVTLPNCHMRWAPGCSIAKTWKICLCLSPSKIGLSCSLWVLSNMFLQAYALKNTADGTQAHNLWIRNPAHYPLCHSGCPTWQEDIIFQTVITTRESCPPSLKSQHLLLHPPTTPSILIRMEMTSRLTRYGAVPCYSHINHCWTRFRPGSNRGTCAC